MFSYQIHTTLEEGLFSGALYLSVSLMHVKGGVQGYEF